MVKKVKENININKYNALLSIVIIAISIALFYFNIFDLITLYKVLILLVGFILAFFVFLKSPSGDKFVHFAKESRIELKKVVWPNRADTLRTTIVVVVIVIIVAIFLSIVDTFFTCCVSTILNRSNFLKFWSQV